jgi:Ca2+-binding EF-hand superfamily protein
VKRALPAIVAIVLALAASALSAADGESTPVDLLYLGDEAVFAVRLNLTADGRSLAEAWERSTHELFGYLDANADGVLTGGELARIPLPAELALLALGESAPAGVPTADLNPRDGKVVPAEFAEYLRRCGAGPMRVLGPDEAMAVRPDAARPIDLRARWDANGDGRLSRGEIASGVVQLRKLDFDDDQALSPAELLPPGGERAGQPSVPRGRPSNAELIPLFRQTPGLALAQRLLALYDVQSREAQAADQHLTREKFPLGTEVFAQADADANGKLDIEEIARWTRQPTPALTLAINLGTDEGATPRMKLAAGGDATLSLRNRASGTLTVGNTSLAVELADEATETNNALARFAAADADSNGYLDAAEMDRAHPGLRRLLDANGDSQAFPEEVEGLLRLRSLLTQGRAVITVERAVANLFEMLDRSGDARLDFAEFSGVLDRAANENGLDAAMTGDEYAAHIKLTLRFGGAIATVPSPGQRLGPAAIRTQRAPIWFERMDRNQDGQVTRREFLGTPAHFSRLDRDANGRLTSNEL